MTEAGTTTYSLFSSPHYLSTAWAEFMRKLSVARVNRPDIRAEGEVDIYKQSLVRCSENYGTLGGLDDEGERRGHTVDVNKLVPSR